MPQWVRRMQTRPGTQWFGAGGGKSLSGLSFPLPQFWLIVGRGCSCLMYQIGRINEADSMHKVSAFL